MWAPGWGCASVRCRAWRSATWTSCVAPSTSGARSSALAAGLSSPCPRVARRGACRCRTAWLALSAHIAQFPPAEVVLPWQAPDGKPAAAQLVFSMQGTGKPVERNSWGSGAWHRALKAAGIQPSRYTGFHQLRHYYASRLLAAGVDVRSLADAMGHHDPGFTLRVYAHLMPDSADRIRLAIDRADASPEGTVTAQKAGSLL
jgi:integrase-like protein